MADTGNRMYCHSCEGVWSQDEGLTCPHCHSDFTEIIEIPPDPDTPPPLIPPESHRASRSPPINPWADHNPWAREERQDRMPFNFMESPSPGYAHRTYRSPDGRFTFSSTTVNSRSEFGWSTRQPSNHPHSMLPAMVQGFDTILREMMGPYPYHPPPHRRSPGLDDPFDPHLPGWSETDDPTGYEELRPRDTDRPQPRAPPVGSLAELLNILQNDPGTQQRQRTDGAYGVAGPHPLAMLSTFLNLAPNGDGVHTQEEFDRVISDLMDRHPHAPGMGAPPASTTAIRSLPKKKIDQEMLGTDDKVECSICMENVKLETEVTVLPCTHWFHPTCIELWLNQHNTCPHCRRSVDSAGDVGRSPFEPDWEGFRNLFEETRPTDGTSENPVVIQDSPSPEASPSAARRRRSPPWSLRSGRSSRSRSGPSSPTPESGDSNRRGSRGSRSSRGSRGERSGFGWLLNRIGGGSE